MIAIKSYAPHALRRYLVKADIDPNAVLYNPREITDEVSVIVQVGGSNIHANHCYVQHWQGIPLIQCYDPKTVMAQPINEVFILCALDKARRISQHGYKPESEDLLLVSDLPATRKYCEDLVAKPGKLISIDIESDPKTSEITCIGFAQDNHAISIPLAYEDQSYWTEAEEVEVWQLIAKVCSSSNPKVFQNFIFDTMMLSKWGVQTNGDIHDTLVAAHLIQPELPKKLADLGRLYIDCPPWKGTSSWVSNEALWRYNARDTLRTLKILEKQLQVLAKDSRLSFFKDHQVPLCTEVLRMCERGWNPDQDKIQEMKEILEPEIALLRQELRDIVEGLIPDKVTYKWRKQKITPGATYVTGVGNPATEKWGKNKKGERILKDLSYDEYEPYEVPADIKSFKKVDAKVFEKIVEEIEFNPASPLQVKAAISGLGYELPKTKNNKGEWAETTNDLSMRRMASKTKDPFFLKLLEFRKKSKLVSTYCNMEFDDDNKLRFSINVAGTVGGRFSSKQTPWGTGCNSQNIPKRFRGISLPHHPGWIIVNMDFSQADPHMVAWLAGEVEMLKILQDPEGDLHSYTASGIVGYDITKQPGYDKDTSKERKLGKACNNGLNYGMGVKRFIDTTFQQTGLELTQGEANEAYKKYFTLYPGIRQWQKDIEAKIQKDRTLVSPFGRKRFFFGNWSDKYKRSKMLNEALSYLPQTTVADALNFGWLNLIKIAERDNIELEMLQQCHDSIKLQCPEGELDKVARALQEAYAAVTFDINGDTCNFPIDIEWGYNWGELKSWTS